MVVCIALGVDVLFGGGPCPPLYIRGDKVTCKVQASSTPIRVVTKEVRYIHELSLTLEHSMPVSSPAAPGLTDRASEDRASQN